MTRALLCFALMSALLGAAPRVPRKLTVSPGNPLLFGKGSSQRLTAVVEYSDGTVQDVTESAVFQSS